MHNDPIDSFLKSQNKNRDNFNKMIKGVKFLTSLIISVTIFSILISNFESYLFSSLIASLITIPILYRIIKFSSLSTIDKANFLIHLETSINDSNIPASSLSKPGVSGNDMSFWQNVLKNKEIENKRIEKSHFKRPLISLLAAATVFSISYQFTASALERSVSNMMIIASAMNRGSYIEAVEGLVKEEEKGTHSLSSGSTVNLTLLPENLVTVQISLPFSDEMPILELRRITSPDEVYQSFQMQNSREVESGKIIDRLFTLSFSLEHASNIVIPAFDSSVPIATIQIEKLPVPEIEIYVSEPNPSDPWPDEKPIKIRVQATSTNPLRMIKFLITTSGRTAEELVANILKDSETEYSYVYPLLLEPYLDQDLSEVEIIAEATDRAVPKPLVGYSEPIRIRTASAYGRYQTALGSLKSLKKYADEARTSGKYTISDKAEKEMQKASDFASDTPFFDTIDRMTIGSLQRRLKSLLVEPNAKSSIVFSLDLDDFLFEHEMLDDRERDRDFFVGSRSISRIIEVEKNKRKIDLSYATKRMKEYLSARTKRWKIRVTRLTAVPAPPEANNILNNLPFHKEIDEIEKIDSDQKGGQEKALIKLSKLVPKYRSWIEALEKAEDTDRQKKEQKRQQSLKQQEDKLKELQKKQAVVSKDLDRASSQKPEDLKKKWQKVKQLQQQIKGQTATVAGEMALMAPEAAERIVAAGEAMSITISTGDKANFMQAESAADLAGRLLRQAQNKAQQQRRQSGSSGRKRRRVSGNNYFGKSIVGGDVVIQRTYEVDRQYREAILNEVRSSSAGEEDKKILNKYLRETVR